MVEVYSIVALVTGLFLITISLYRLKKQEIAQGTFVFWMIAGIIAVVIGSIPAGLSAIQQFLGTEFSISALFGITVIPLIILVYYLHQKIDLLNQRVSKLVAELAANRFYKPAGKED